MNPNSLALIIQSARAGKVSPYNIKLSAISERLLAIIIHAESVTPTHLEALDRAASLFQMKSEFVANGGRFIEHAKSSIFDENQAFETLDANHRLLTQFKEIIARNIAVSEGSYPRPTATIESEEFTVPKTTRLVAIAARLAQRREVDTTNPVVVRRKTINLAAAMAEVMERLKRGIQVLFHMLFSKTKSRFDIITKLLAVLELVKRKKVAVFQEEPFGPILIEKI